MHPRARSWIFGRKPLDLPQLNALIYSQLFLTPADDAWLGLGTPGTFTGLPADGIVRDPQ